MDHSWLNELWLSIFLFGGVFLWTRLNTWVMSKIKTGGIDGMVPKEAAIFSLACWLWVVGLIALIASVLGGFLLLMYYILKHFRP